MGFRQFSAKTVPLLFCKKLPLTSGSHARLKLLNQFSNLNRRRWLLRLQKGAFI